ncbi:hypothetical protein B4096_1820 [Heyndrickxia coagulans]|nr:hypothetical protein B4096_1820 [Heyndrickxia coagulans]
MVAKAVSNLAKSRNFAYAASPISAPGLQSQKGSKYPLPFFSL